MYPNYIIIYSYYTIQTTSDKQQTRTLQIDRNLMLINSTIDVLRWIPAALISTVQDSIVEGDQSFQVAVSTNSTITIGTPSSATAVIRDDDRKS